MFSDDFDDNLFLANENAPKLKDFCCCCCCCLWSNKTEKKIVKPSRF